MTLFEIPGIPGVWQRAGLNRKSGRIFTPKGPAAYKTKVVMLAKAAGATPLDGPVCLTVEAIWPTLGAPRKREPRPECWKDTRPDIDNVVKLICDSLNGVCWHDDAQVARVTATKRHAKQGASARVIVCVTRML